MPPVTLASGAATHAADIAGQTASRTSFGIANEILLAANNVRVNKRAAVALSERVHEMAGAIISLSEDTSFNSEWAHWAAFQRVLTEVHEELHSLSHRNFLSQALHERRDREKLVHLSENVRNAFSALMVSLL